MTIFSYRAYDNSGAKFEGEIDAIDKQRVIAELKSQGLLASEIKPVVQKGQSVCLQVFCGIHLHEYFIKCFVIF